MNILVLDSSGLVGHTVAMYFKENAHNVTGYSAAQSNIVNTVVGSLTDTEKIENTVKTEKYDAIINCSAVINQDADENKTEAVLINSYIPHFLEKITAETGTVVVHRSTDCVFSGVRGQYTTDDMPDATSFYARTKAVGELINGKDITIRTSLIGPDYIKDGGDLFNWYYTRHGDVKGYANSIWTGLTTIEYARETEALLKQNAHGLFQLVPDYSISKYELLKMFEKYFPSDRNIIRVDNKKVDKSLIQAVNGYCISIPDYDSMVAGMSEWIKAHGEFYPNYK